MPGVPGHTQILADQLTLFQAGGTDYANLITTGTPGFSDLRTALHSTCKLQYQQIAKDVDFLSMYLNFDIFCPTNLN